MSLRNKRSLHSSPPPRQTRSQTNSRASTPHRSEQRYSSSSEDGEDGEVLSATSLVLDTTAAPVATTPATAVDSIASGSTRKKRPTRSNRAGIDYSLQKLLAEDVEAFGGLDQVLSGITRFCNEQEAKDSERASFYGPSKSRDRIRVENKLRNWGKFEHHSYRELLDAFQVWPAGTRQGKPDIISSGLQVKPEQALSSFPSEIRVPNTEPVLVKSEEQHTQQDFLWDTSFDCERQDLVSSQLDYSGVDDTSIHHGRLNHPPRSPYTGLEAGISKLSVSQTKHSTMQNTAYNTYSIKVDTENPENNRELVIYSVSDLEGLDASEEYPGYFCMLPIDGRIYDESDEEAIEHYKGRVISNHQVLITMPGLPYCHHNEKDRDSFATDDFVSVNCLKAMDIARNKYLKEIDPDKGKFQRRKWKNLLLDFPEDHELSTKVLFNEAGDNEEVPFDIISGDDKTFYFAFKVANIRRGSNKVGKMSKGRKGKSKMAEKLEAAKLKGANASKSNSHVDVDADDPMDDPDYDWAKWMIDHVSEEYDVLKAANWRNTDIILFFKRRHKAETDNDAYQLVQLEDLLDNAREEVARASIDATAFHNAMKETVASVSLVDMDVDDPFGTMEEGNKRSFGDMESVAASVPTSQVNFANENDPVHIIQELPEELKATFKGIELFRQKQLLFHCLDQFLAQLPHEKQALVSHEPTLYQKYRKLTELMAAEQASQY